MNRYLHSVSVCLPSIIFILIFWYIFIGPQWANIIIRLYVETDAADTITIFWPDKAGQYSEDRSRRVACLAGKSGHELSIRAYPSAFPLRFDPGEQQTRRFILREISFERFGITTTLTGREVASRIRRTSNVQIISDASAADSLHMLLTSSDPQIYFINLPQPLPSLKYAAVFFAVLLLMGISGRCFLIRSVDAPVRMTAGAIIALLLCAVNGIEMLYQQIILSGLYALISSCGLLFIWVCISKRVSFSTALLIPVCIALLTVPMISTPAPDFVQNVHKHILKLQNDKDGLHKRLQHIRFGLQSAFIRRFAFRKQLINLNARLKISILGFSPTSKAVLGRNGMFFEGYGRRRVEGDIIRPFDNITDYMGQIPFSPEELEGWRISLEERYYWLKERGIDYVFAIAPTKALVYPENLPACILWTKNRINKPIRYEQLVNYLRKKSIVPVADLRAALLKTKQSAELPLFYRTDFHWNYYGSLIAYQEIVRVINQYYPKHDLQPALYSDFIVNRKDDWVHINFMGVLGLDPMQNRNETYLKFFPEAGGRYAEIDLFMEQGISDYSLPKMTTQKYAGELLGVREIKNPLGKIRLMFIIGDSFIEKTIGYFSVHNRRTVNFRAVTNFPTGPYQEHRPDIVIQEILNMYILQHPPVNPPAVQQARKRAMVTLQSLDQSINPAR